MSLPFPRTGKIALALRTPADPLNVDKKGNPVRHTEHYWMDPTAWDDRAMLESHIDWLYTYNDAGYDIFYSTGSFEPVTTPLDNYTGRRIANCVGQRSLFLDIDSDKYGSDVDSALESLVQVTQAMSLPPPSLIVNSGGGLHVYWTCTEDIPLAQWPGLASRLRNGCAAAKLRFDGQCTIDRTRVLRVPGFRNPKYQDRWVEILFEGREYSLGELVAMLAPFPALDLGQAPAVASDMFPGLVLQDMGGLTSAFAAALEGKPASWGRIEQASLSGAGCGVLARIMNDNTEANYALWCGALSIVRCTDDHNRGISITSEAHPDFDVGATVRKMNEFAGPRTCQTLGADAQDHWGISPCATCSHRGRIKSPVELGRDHVRIAGETVQVDMSPAVPAPSAAPATAPGQVIDLLTGLPVTPAPLAPPAGTPPTLTTVVRPAYPYCYHPTKRGCWMESKRELTEEEGGPGQVTEYHHLHDITFVCVDVSELRSEGGNLQVSSTFEYVNAHGKTIQLVIPNAAFASFGGGAVTTVLSAAGIPMPRNPNVTKDLIRFLEYSSTAMIDAINATPTAVRMGLHTPEPDDDNPTAVVEAPYFVYGRTKIDTAGNISPVKVVKPSGVLSENGVRMAQEMRSLPVTEAGRAAAVEGARRWAEFIKGTMVDPANPGRYALDQWVLMSGFAAALSSLASDALLTGGMIGLHGKSGGSKTTLIRAIVSIYARGAGTQWVVKDSTDMSFGERYCAFAHSMPCVLEEVTQGSAGSKELGSWLLDKALKSTDSQVRVRLNTNNDRDFTKWRSWSYCNSNEDLIGHIRAQNQADSGAIARLLSLFADPARMVDAPDSNKDHGQQLPGWMARHGGYAGQLWIPHLMTNLPRLTTRLRDVQRELERMYPAKDFRFLINICASTIVATEEVNAIGLLDFEVESIRNYSLFLLDGQSGVMRSGAADRSSLLQRLLNDSLAVSVIYNNGVPSLMQGAPRAVCVRRNKCGKVLHVDVSTEYLNRWLTKHGLTMAEINEAMASVAGARRGMVELATGTPWSCSAMPCIGFDLTVDEALVPVT